MVYVRDRQSANGTLVNGNLIGRGLTVSPGWLLQDGDKITMKRNMDFKIRMLDFSRNPRLTFAQRKEVELFDDCYTITNKILGSGAHCEVRMAVNKKTGAQVACKIYDLEKMRHCGALGDIRSVLNAVSVFKQLDHPNLASFECAYESRSTLYTFEALAAGGDLYSLLNRLGAFKELEVRWMMHQTLQGLGHMHEKGIAHRDIKQENIICMVCPKPGHRIAITDFGHSDSMKAGRRSSFCGTSGKQAPEQLLGDGSHHLACDMWAIGILAAHLLAGNSNMTTLNALEDLINAADAAGLAAFDVNIVFDEIRSHRQYHTGESDVSPEAVDFIRRCLTTDEPRRITAAEALRHPWLHEPACTRELFAVREAQNALIWGPRQESDHEIRLLPDVLTSPYHVPVIQVSPTMPATSTVLASPTLPAATVISAAPATSATKTIWKITTSPPSITVTKMPSHTGSVTAKSTVTRVPKAAKKVPKITKVYKVTKGGATGGRQKILGVSAVAAGEISRHFARQGSKNGEDEKDGGERYTE